MGPLEIFFKESTSCHVPFFWRSSPDQTDHGEVDGTLSTDAGVCARQAGVYFSFYTSVDQEKYGAVLQDTLPWIRAFSWTLKFRDTRSQVHNLFSQSFLPRNQSLRRELSKQIAKAIIFIVITVLAKKKDQVTRYLYFQIYPFFPQIYS